LENGPGKLGRIRQAAEAFVPRFKAPFAGVHLADTLTNSHHMFPEQNNLSVFLVIASEHAGDGGLRHQ
jgi:hypothetical protein